jgi:hypothetical protein
MTEAFERFDVWRVYVDPQWIEHLADRWQGRWGEKRVVKWFTNRPADRVGGATPSCATRGKQKLNVYDEEHRQMHTISKDRPDSPRKMDLAMAAVLSWEARSDAIAAAPDSASQRLTVQGFRFNGGEDADGDAWGIWQRNSLDSESILLHTEAIKVGEGYVLVTPTGDGPRITVEDPAHCEVELDPADRRRRVAGLRCWPDVVTGNVLANLYLPNAIYRWQGRRQRSGEIFWTARDDEPLPNDLGIVPLVPFLNSPGLYGGRSDLRDVIPLLNAVNKLCLDMMVAAEFGAYRQKILSGIGEIRDQHGNTVDNFEEVMGNSRLLTIPSKDAKVTDLAASDLSNYTTAIESLLQHIAAITSTPPPYMLTGSGVLPSSGEALKVAESGLVAKVRRKMVTFGESWEEVARLAFRARADAGDDDKADDYAAETIWVDPESRTEAQRVDALVKLRQGLGIPQTELWKMVPWATETLVKRWKAAAADEALAAQLADPLAAQVTGPPAATPPTVVVEPAG